MRPDGTRVLVTGGLGHVGSVLVRELRGRGYEVWVLDRWHKGDPQYLRCNVREYRQLVRVMRAHHFNYVYHAAAEFGRKNGEDFYEELWQTNAIGTKNVLRLQEEQRFRMVFFSSSEVYGDFSGVMSEDVMDRFEIRQLNDYAISKWAGELQVINSGLQHQTESARVRLFNVYGPGERYSPYRSALCLFCYHALHRLPYVVYEGHRRSWLYVDDAARTLANLVDRFTPGEVYNLGTTDLVEMRRLSDLVLALTRREAVLARYEREEPFTTREKRVDTSKAARYLDHRPTVNLETGLARTIEWMRKEYGIHD